MEDSELLKTVKALILFERDTYLLYADATKKMENPECRNILHTMSEQTKGHMMGVRRIFNELVESTETLDEETSSLLSNMKDALSDTKADPAKILKASLGIEEKMADIYGKLAEEKKLEAEFQEILGSKAQKEYIEKLVSIVTQISIEEYYHKKLVEDAFGKYLSQSEKE